MSNIKSPPIFHPEEDDDYISWKNDVGIWKVFTETKEDKIGAAVYLSLQGKAREVVRDLNPEEVGTVNGYKLILEKLDGIYLQDEDTRAFCAFNDFF